jgi:DNA-binding CsgD family transcriptional regulator
VQASGQPSDYVVLAEAQREASHLPSALGRRFSAASPGLRVLWGPARLTAMADVTQERALPIDLRGTLLSMGTAAKLALPLRDGAVPIGLMCADWHAQAPRWDSEACNQLPVLASEALGPLLRSAAQLAMERGRQQGLLLPSPVPADGTLPPPDLGALTPAELKVAHLASTGLTYKEIARHLDRSLSTVDHQLRAIRDKLGVRSTARLVHVLSEHFERSRD